MKKLILLLIIGSISAGVALAPQNLSSPVRSSSSYAEGFLKKTQVEADLASIAGDYTETHPKLAELNDGLASLTKAIDRLNSVPAADASRLTEALGRLMVERSAVDAELSRLRRGYTDQSPQVQRAK